MPTSRFGPSRQGFQTGLVVTAAACGVIASLLAVAILVSGTTTTHGGSQVLLKDLALGSFDGIIPNNETSGFLVHLSWFMGSFSWEYPNAPEGTPTIGFTSTGPHFSANIVKDLRSVATKLDLPRKDWDCPRSGSSARSCENIFFQVWRTAFAVGGFPLVNPFIWIMLVAAVYLTALRIAQEWMIRKRPYWMRCRCIILKRYCPYPNGTREEIEKMDDFVWDKIRLLSWALIVVYYFFPAVHAGLDSAYVSRVLNNIDGGLPEGISMNPRTNEAPLIVLWVAFALSTMAALCMLVKWTLSRRPKGWMEERDLAQVRWRKD